MPPKGNNADTTVTHPLQAVVLADSFTRTFRPMSLERPKVLLPLANSPMIEYTLEMLANAKVKEIIVVCCWHAAQVAEYLKQSRWGASRNPVVRVVSYPRAASAGDALRELAETRSVQSDPFILISGDVVSNVRLGPVLRAHNSREDKNKVMTMLFRKTLPGNPLRNFDDDLVVAVNAETQQLLLYEVDEGEQDEDNEGEISLRIGSEDFFKEHPKLELRHDLLDCHIDICSPQVLDLITDEFYADLRLDMVRKEVANRELDHHFYVHELTMPQDYAARVHCVRSYDQVSKDVIGRWLYPLTPDNNWSRADGSCWFTRGFMYREAGVQVDRNAKIGRCTMLGAESSIGDGAVIEHSVLGRRVIVRPKAMIKGSYIWDDVEIRAGAQIDRAVICNDAVIGEGAKIMRGAIVSFGVVVGANEVVLPFTRLTKADPYTDDRGSWDDGSEDHQASPRIASTPDTTTAGNVKLNAPAFQVGGADADDKLSAREYTMEEEDFDEPILPNWVSKALDDATGIWKASKTLVMGSMGCEELDRAKANRSWFPLDPGSRMSIDSKDGMMGEMPRVSKKAGIRKAESMDESLPSQTAHVLSEFLANPKNRSDGFFADLSMELKALRSSRAACSFEQISAVSFAVMLASTLADHKNLTSAQLKERITNLVDSVAGLLKRFTHGILNKEEDIQVAIIQAAEVLCLIGPSLAPEVLVDLAAADYRLDKAVGVDDLEPILRESMTLRACFVMLLIKLAGEEVIEYPALQRWKREREALKATTETRLLEMYNAAGRHVDQLIQMLITQHEEDNDDDDDDEDEESDE